MVNQALKSIEPLLSSMYSGDMKGGRPAISSEKLLRAMLLQTFYSIRSERMLMEQTQYNLLFRWFIGLSMDDTVWVPTVFTKNRERLIAHDAVIELFNEVLAIANKNDWLSGEHFSVDGMLIQAWAGHKSFARKEASDDDTGNFKGQSRSNDTYASTTAADGYGEREAAKVMIADARQVAGEKAQITLGADKGCDAAEFIGLIRQVMVRGLKTVDQLFVLTMAAYSLTRMRTLWKIRLQRA